MIYVFLADGFEEIEALTTVDLLRRVDVSVSTVAIGCDQYVKGSHNITVKADLCENDIKPDENCDGIVLPGGVPGADNLFESETVDTFLKYCDENKKHIAAICAAPYVLGQKGLLNGKKAVCYDGFEDRLKGAEVLNVRVVTDDNITTGCGPGAAMEFALRLVEIFGGDEAYKKMEAIMLCRR